MREGPEKAVEEKVASIDRWVQGMLAGAGDTASLSPAQALGAAMERMDVDIEDPAAVDAFVHRWNEDQMPGAWSATTSLRRDELPKRARPGGRVDHFHPKRRSLLVAAAYRSSRVTQGGTTGVLGFAALRKEAKMGWTQDSFGTKVDGHNVLVEARSGPISARFALKVDGEVQDICKAIHGKHYLEGVIPGENGSPGRPFRVRVVLKAGGWPARNTTSRSTARSASLARATSSEPPSAGCAQTVAAADRVASDTFVSDPLRPRRRPPGSM